jgi:hypothetical protein
MELIAEVRVGVFYDGDWWGSVADYFANVHTWRARLSFPGVHDALRWHIAAVTGCEVTGCEVAGAHYVQGRDSGGTWRGFDEVLQAAGVVRHDVPRTGRGREKGADVALALEAWESAAGGAVNHVVLVTGDAGLVPLITRLRERGTHVTVPVVDAEFRDPRGGTTRELRTAPGLRDAASSAPWLEVLLRDAMAPGYPLLYPFTAAATGQHAAGTGPRRHGTMTRWRDGDRWGFVMDGKGQTWYVASDQLPDGLPTLPPGAYVSWSGSPSPAPGRRYPQAYTVRLEHVPASSLNGRGAAAATAV